MKLTMLVACFAALFVACSSSDSDQVTNAGSDAAVVDVPVAPDSEVTETSSDAGEQDVLVETQVEAQVEAAVGEAAVTDAPVAD